MHFGVTATPCSTWIRFGRRILVVVLRNKREASVSMPTEAEVKSHVEAIGLRHPLLWAESVMGAMDGLKLFVLQASCDDATQNRFYNGWTHDHYVTNVFYFVPDGTCDLCASIVLAPCMTVWFANMAACRRMNTNMSRSKPR